MASTAIYTEGEDLKSQWKDASADFTPGDEHLEIKGKPVMEKWETPFMHSLATVAASKGTISHSGIHLWLLREPFSADIMALSLCLPALPSSYACFHYLLLL